MTKEEFVEKLTALTYAVVELEIDEDEIKELKRDILSDLNSVIKVEVDKAMEGAYPQEFIHYLLTLDQADDSAKNNDPYPDTEAGGYVFCGKCGKML